MQGQKLTSAPGTPRCEVAVHPVVAGVVPVLTAAGLGNAFVSKDSLAWFQGLRRPPMQLPMSGFYTIGAAYYLIMGVVTCRAVARGDGSAYRLALAVLAGNELWNVALFGRRSPRAGFLGVLAFLVPLGLLQLAVRADRTSTIALGVYTTYVIAYDLPWSRQLWRLNPGKNL